MTQVMSDYKALGLKGPQPAFNFGTRLLIGPPGFKGPISK